MAIILIEYHYSVSVQEMISFTFQAQARGIRVSELIEQRRMWNKNDNSSDIYLHIFILLVFKFLILMFDLKLKGRQVRSLTIDK